MGRWLIVPAVCAGYGATPLPSIYDALVYEKNITLAQKEVYRVQHLLEAMVEEIKP